MNYEQGEPSVSLRDLCMSGSQSACSKCPSFDKKKSEQTRRRAKSPGDYTKHDLEDDQVTSMRKHKKRNNCKINGSNVSSKILQSHKNKVEESVIEEDIKMSNCSCHVEAVDKNIMMDTEMEENVHGWKGAEFVSNKENKVSGAGLKKSLNLQLEIWNKLKSLHLLPIVNSIDDHVITKYNCNRQISSNQDIIFQSIQDTSSQRSGFSTRESGSSILSQKADVQSARAKIESKMKQSYMNISKPKFDLKDKYYSSFHCQGHTGPCCQKKNDMTYHIVAESDAKNCLVGCSKQRRTNVSDNREDCNLQCCTNLDTNLTAINSGAYFAFVEKQATGNVDADVCRISVKSMSADYGHINCLDEQPCHDSDYLHLNNTDKSLESTLKTESNIKLLCEETFSKTFLPCINIPEDQHYLQHSLDNNIILEPEWLSPPKNRLSHKKFDQKPLISNRVGCFWNMSSEECTIDSLKWSNRDRSCSCDREDTKEGLDNRLCKMDEVIISGWRNESVRDISTNLDVRSSTSIDENIVRQPWTCTKWTDEVSIESREQLNQPRWVYEVYSNTCQNPNTEQTTSNITRNIHSQRYKADDFNSASHFKLSANSLRKCLNNCTVFGNDVSPTVVGNDFSSRNALERQDSIFSYKQSVTEISSGCPTFTTDSKFEAANRSNQEPQYKLENINRRGEESQHTCRVIQRFDCDSKIDSCPQLKSACEGANGVTEVRDAICCTPPYFVLNRAPAECRTLKVCQQMKRAPEDINLSSFIELPDLSRSDSGNTKQTANGTEDNIKRTVNSIRKDIEGVIKMLNSLKVHEDYRGLSSTHCERDVTLDHNISSRKLEAVKNVNHTIDHVQRAIDKRMFIRDSFSSNNADEGTNSYNDYIRGKAEYTRDRQSADDDFYIQAIYPYRCTKSTSGTSFTDLIKEDEKTKNALKRHDYSRADTLFSHQSGLNGAPELKDEHEMVIERKRKKTGCRTGYFHHDLALESQSSKCLSLHESRDPKVFPNVFDNDSRPSHCGGLKLSEVMASELLSRGLKVKGPERKNSTTPRRKKKRNRVSRINDFQIFYQNDREMYGVDEPKKDELFNKESRRITVSDAVKTSRGERYRKRGNRNEPRDRVELVIRMQRSTGDNLSKIQLASEGIRSRSSGDTDIGDINIMENISPTTNVNENTEAVKEIGKTEQKEKNMPIPNAQSEIGNSCKSHHNVKIVCRAIIRTPTPRAHVDGARPQLIDTYAGNSVKETVESEITNKKNELFKRETNKQHHLKSHSTKAQCSMTPSSRIRNVSAGRQDKPSKRRRRRGRELRVKQQKQRNGLLGNYVSDSSGLSSSDVSLFRQSPEKWRNKKHTRKVSKKVQGEEHSRQVLGNKVVIPSLENLQTSNMTGSNVGVILEKYVTPSKMVSQLQENYDVQSNTGAQLQDNAALSSTGEQLQKNYIAASNIGAQLRKDNVALSNLGAQLQKNSAAASNMGAELQKNYITPNLEVMIQNNYGDPLNTEVKQKEYHGAPSYIAAKTQNNCGSPLNIEVQQHENYSAPASSGVKLQGKFDDISNIGVQLQENYSAKPDFRAKLHENYCALLNFWVKLQEDCVATSNSGEKLQENCGAPSNIGVKLQENYVAPPNNEGKLQKNYDPLSNIQEKPQDSCVDQSNLRLHIKENYGASARNEKAKGFSQTYDNVDISNTEGSLSRKYNEKVTCICATINGYAVPSNLHNIDHKDVNTDYQKEAWSNSLQEMVASKDKSINPVISTSMLNVSMWKLYTEINKLRMQLEGSVDDTKSHPLPMFRRQEHLLQRAQSCKASIDPMTQKIPGNCWSSYSERCTKIEHLPGSINANQKADSYKTSIDFSSGIKEISGKYRNSDKERCSKFKRLTSSTNLGNSCKQMMSSTCPRTNQHKGTRPGSIKSQVYENNQRHREADDSHKVNSSVSPDTCSSICMQKVSKSVVLSELEVEPVSSGHPIQHAGTNQHSPLTEPDLSATAGDENVSNRLNDDMYMTAPCDTSETDKFDTAESDNDDSSRRALEASKKLVKTHTFEQITADLNINSQDTEIVDTYRVAPVKERNRTARSVSQILEPPSIYDKQPEDKRLPVFATKCMQHLQNQNESSRESCINNNMKPSDFVACPTVLKRRQNMVAIRQLPECRYKVVTPSSICQDLKSVDAVTVVKDLSGFYDYQTVDLCINNTSEDNLRSTSGTCEEWKVLSVSAKQNISQNKGSPKEEQAVFKFGLNKLESADEISMNDEKKFISPRNPHLLVESVKDNWFGSAKMKPKHQTHKTCIKSKQLNNNGCMELLKMDHNDYMKSLETDNVDDMKPKAMDYEVRDGLRFVGACVNSTEKYNNEDIKLQEISGNGLVDATLTTAKSVKIHACPPTERGRHSESYHSQISKMSNRGSDISFHEVCVCDYKSASWRDRPLTRHLDATLDHMPVRNNYLDKTRQSSSHPSSQLFEGCEKDALISGNEISCQSQDYDYDERWKSQKIVSACGLTHEESALDVQTSHKHSNIGNVRELCAGTSTLLMEPDRFMRHYSDAINVSSKNRLRGLSLSRIDVDNVSKIPDSQTEKSIQDLPGYRNESSEIFEGVTNKNCHDRSSSISKSDPNRHNEHYKPPSYSTECVPKTDALVPYSDRFAKEDSDIMALFENMMRQKRPYYVEHCGFRQKKKDCVVLGDCSPGERKGRDLSINPVEATVKTVCQRQRFINDNNSSFYIQPTKLLTSETKESRVGLWHVSNDLYDVGSKEVCCREIYSSFFHLDGKGNHLSRNNGDNLTVVENKENKTSFLNYCKKLRSREMDEGGTRVDIFSNNETGTQEISSCEVSDGTTLRSKLTSIDIASCESWHTFTDLDADRFSLMDEKENFKLLDEADHFKVMDEANHFKVMDEAKHFKVMDETNYFKVMDEKGHFKGKDEKGHSKVIVEAVHFKLMDDKDKFSLMGQTDHFSLKDKIDNFSFTHEEHQLTLSNKQDHLLFMDEKHHLLLRDENNLFSSRDETDHHSLTNDTNQMPMSDAIDHFSSRDDTNQMSLRDESDNLSLKDETDHFSSRDETEHLSLRNDTNHMSLSDETDHLTSRDETNHMSLSDETYHFSSRDEINHMSLRDESEDFSFRDETDHISLNDETDRFS